MVILVLFVLCVASCLLVVGLFSCLVPNCVLLLCLVDTVKHCDNLHGEEGAG